MVLAPRLLGVCERYTGSEAEAEDVLQEAFVKIFGRLSDFRGEGAFEGWAHRIAVTTALNHYKREKAHRQLHVLEEAATDLTSQEADELEQLGAEETIALIKRLPDGCRHVLNLYAIEGYSHAEIGKMLNIQESTSKSQLCKARKMLVQLLAQQEPAHARAK